MLKLGITREISFGKDKIPNFRFRRDKRELKYINKRREE